MMASAIRAARVLPHSSADMIEDGVVIVNGDRIQKVGTWAAISQEVADGIPVTDLGDVTLMPGLFDCHVTLARFPSGAVAVRSHRRGLTLWF